MLGSGQESRSRELFFHFRHLKWPGATREPNGSELEVVMDKSHNDTTEVVVKRDDSGRLHVSCCILAA